MAFTLHTTHYSLINNVCLVDTHSNDIVSIEFSPAVEIGVNNGHILPQETTS